MSGYLGPSDHGVPDQRHVAGAPRPAGELRLHVDVLEGALGEEALQLVLLKPSLQGRAAVLAHLGLDLLRSRQKAEGRGRSGSSGTSLVSDSSPKTVRQRVFRGLKSLEIA